MSPGSTKTTLHLLGMPLRALRGVSISATGIGAVTLALGVAAWAAALGVFDQPYWVFVAWLVVLTILGVGIWHAWRQRHVLSDTALARHLERRPEWRTGQLLSLLGPAAEGTSAQLVRAADQAEAASLEHNGATALLPLRRRLVRRATSSGFLMGMGLLTLVTAGPLDGPAAALWHPGEAWEATTAPVRIRVDQSVVDRGDSVVFAVEAIGRRRATLWTRAPGESWRPRDVDLDEQGRAAVTTGPLYSDLFARLTSGSRGSDTLMVQVRLPAFLGSLELMARYPRYLRLQDEPLPVSGDTLLLPVGTRLEVRGEATTDLARVGWTVDQRTIPMEVDGAGFRGVLRPAASGTYRLDLATVSGGVLAGDTVAIPIRLIPDGVPQVDVPVPGTDTLAPLSLRLILVVDAHDDYGLDRLRLRARRITSLGVEDSLASQPIPLPGEQPDRAIVTHLFDLNGFGLLPGDTVRYRVEAWDNAPRSQMGASPEYVLRLPTMSEVRAAARAASESVGARLDSLAERSRQLERQTEDLSRERQRSENDGAGQREEALSFDDAERAEAAARSQQELMQEAQALHDAMEALQQGARDAGLDDPDWQAQVSEIREQLQRAMSPELRAKLDELQQALQELDADRTREALEDLAEAQRELREALERSRELFRRAAVEGEMANLSEEASDLAQEQERWTDEVMEADSAAAAALEERLSQRADSLAEALSQLGEQLQDEAMQQAMQDAAQQASEAAQQMQSAADLARMGDMSGAQQQGQQALQQLQPLGDQLQQQRSDLQEQWREEVLAALDQGLAEASRLLEQQLRVARSARAGASPARQRADQAAVEEGVQKLVERMQKLSGENALVPQEIATALAAAQRQMELSREALSTGTPNQREAGERAGQGGDALNAAAYLMLRARGDVSGSGSGSGMTEAMEQMSQLAQQQGQLSQQAGSMLPMIGQSGMQEQLMALSESQRRLAEELERMQAQGDVPQAGPLAEEARELARRLEAGRLDRETVSRQERLFRRLLDQGRTMQGQEEDEEKERQSRTPETDSVRLPPALRAQLRDDSDQIRLPSWEELQRFSPDERRLVVEYFRQLTDARSP